MASVNKKIATTKRQRTSHGTHTTKNYNFYINATPYIFTERNDQCGNQYYSCELLMMGIVVPETC